MCRYSFGALLWQLTIQTISVNLSSRRKTPILHRPICATDFYERTMTEKRQNGQDYLGTSENLRLLVF